jgi:endoglucanase
MKNIFLLFFLLQFNTALAQSLAHTRAHSISRTMNYSWLENYWSGNATINYTNYADKSHINVVKPQLQLMQQLNFNCLRLPVCFDKWEDRIAPYNIDSVSYFKLLDTIVSWCSAYNLKLIIDYHHGELRDATMLTELPRIIKLWQQIATHFVYTNPNNVLFEIYNEPYSITANAWQLCATSIVDSIRKILPQHTLIVGGNNWNNINALADLGVLADTNIIYNFHYYEPTIFTHQGATWIGDAVATKGVPFPYNANAMPSLNPLAIGTWGEGAFNYYNIWGNCDSVIKPLQTGKNFATLHNVPVTCNEFGSFANYAPTDDSRCRYTKCIADALTALQIPYGYWEWDGGFSFFNANPPAYAGINDCFKDAFHIAPLPVSNITAQSEIEFFPNPSNTILNFKNTALFKTISIFNTQGECIIKNNCVQNIAIGNLNAGIYFLQFTNTQNVKSRFYKFIKN